MSLYVMRTLRTGALPVFGLYSSLPVSGSNFPNSRILSLSKAASTGRLEVYSFSMCSLCESIGGDVLISGAKGQEALMKSVAACSTFARRISACWYNLSNRSLPSLLSFRVNSSLLHTPYRWQIIGWKVHSAASACITSLRFASICR